MTNKSINQNSGILEVLRKIEAKPGMYLGKPSIDHLFMFLVGYKTARRELGQELTAQEEDFCGEFQPWLQQKYRLQTVASWSQIISSHTADDAEALQMFFQLLDEFLSRNKTAKNSLVA
jgi:hypothetical protein